MTPDPRTHVTEILERLTAAGNAGKRPEDLLPLIYDELRRLAASYLRRERPEHTLRFRERSGAGGPMVAGSSGSHAAASQR